MKVKLKDDEIQYQLARKNMTQDLLAQRLGITTGYMSQIMCGVRNPSPRLREKIMQQFPECDFDELFDIKTTKNES